MSILKKIEEGAAFESVIDLEEISKDLTKRYYSAASKDNAEARGQRSMEFHANGKSLKWNDLKKKSIKREKGLDMAVKKLAKEDVEKSEARKSIESILEDGAILKKRGRPRKERHEDGEIIKDPKTNS